MSKLELYQTEKVGIGVNKENYKIIYAFEKTLGTTVLFFVGISMLKSVLNLTNMWNDLNRTGS